MPSVLVKGEGLPEGTIKSLLAYPSMKMGRNICVTNKIEEINFGERYTIYAFIGSNESISKKTDTTNVFVSSTVNTLRDVAIKFMTTYNLNKDKVVSDDVSHWRKPIEEAVRRSLGNKVEKIRDSLYYEKSFLSALKLALVDMERRVQERRDEFGDIEGVGFNKLVDRAIEHVLRLKKTDKFESIEFQSDALVAITSPIYVNARNKWYFLGRYQIKVHFNGSIDITQYDRITKKNEETGEEKVVERLHPHNNGRWCWGRNLNLVTQLSARHDYFQLLLFLHRFLSHANVNDPWGSTISLWPTLSKAEVEKLGLEEDKKSHLVQGSGGNEDDNKSK